MKTILIVEDDKLLNKTLTYNLKLDGYEVSSMYSYEETIKSIKHDKYDLILLDVNLPDGNGFELCGQIKESNAEAYIIFLTANSRESDMLKGYEVGGADYITKPFSIAVLGKKITAVFKNQEQNIQSNSFYDDGVLRIDFSKNVAMYYGKQIEFTPKEFKALCLLYTNRKQIVTKRHFMEKLWSIDDAYIDEHTLTTIISRLRKKIEVEGRRYIKTSYGIGYQWIEQEDKFETKN